MQRSEWAKGCRIPELVPAFSPLSETTIYLLDDLPEALSYPAGTRLLEQDKHPQEVGLIRSGIVKLVHENESLEDYLVGLRSAGWWVGGTQTLLNLNSLYSVVAHTDCTISYIPATELANTLASNSRILHHFMTAQARELVMVQQHSLMRGSSAEERLRYLLGESSLSIWETVDPTLVMRQSDIAQLLGITPEHLSRLRSRRRERRNSERTAEGETKTH